MSTTFAEINDRVYLELEIAAEFCSLDKIHNAVVQQHNVCTAQSRSSAINVMLGLSAQFTPTTANPYDVTALIGKGVPAFLEYLDTDSVWRLIRIVSLYQLPDYNQLGVLAAAFYGEELSSATVEPIQYVQFSFVPPGACRIRFDRDIIRTGLVQNIDMPDHVAELIVKRAQNQMIPRMKLAIDMRTRNDETLRGMAQAIKQTLTEIMEQNLIDIKPLHELWKIWAFRDRQMESSFNKVTPSSKGSYGYGLGGSIY